MTMQLKSLRLAGVCCCFLLFNGCGAPAPEGDFPRLSDENLISLADNPNVERTIGDDGMQFSVMGPSAFSSAQAAGEIFDNKKPQDEIEARGLIIGFPKSIINTKQLFGGVVTGVDFTSTKPAYHLTTLKLSKLGPYEVFVKIGRDKNDNVLLGLIPCKNHCVEPPTGKPLVLLPVVGKKDDKYLVDFSEIGRELNIVTISDPKGSHSRLKAKSSSTVLADYSDGVAVFDVKARMAHLTLMKNSSDESEGENKPQAAVTSDVTVTARWFLRPTNLNHKQFVQRPTTPEVGFFPTEKNISRFAIASDGRKGPIPYFVKNVPPEFKNSLAASFQKWNSTFMRLTRKPVFAWKFIDKTDSQYRLIVAGDPRYNVVEWDEGHEAPYHGMGPSLVDPQTGEVFSASVLLQGPQTQDYFRKWFAAAGKTDEGKMNADASWKNELSEMMMTEEENRNTKVELQLSDSFTFQSSADLPRKDSIQAIKLFHDPPAGESLLSYSSKFWTGVLEHELGHNLGLMHNFKGSLGADGGAKQSRSVMEYLDYQFSHQMGIDEYDLMAISYGYLGKKPLHTDWFCSDYDLASSDDPSTSPECMSTDATSDPFGYFESELSHLIDLLVAKGSAKAPTWEARKMLPVLLNNFSSLLLYYTNAETADSWTNWQTGSNDRPSDAANIPEYVAGRLKLLVCDKSHIEAALSKNSQDAKDLAISNIAAVRAIMPILGRESGIAKELLTCDGPKKPNQESTDSETDQP